MNRTFTRMMTALTGPALAAGILAAGLVTSAPAQAQMSSGQTQNCTTSTGVGADKSAASNRLTRAGQINAATPSAASAPTSCVGH